MIRRRLDIACTFSITLLLLCRRVCLHVRYHWLNQAWHRMIANVSMAVGKRARQAVMVLARPRQADIVPRIPMRVESRRHLFGQTFEVGQISAIRRQATGSKLAQWARHNQLIPGVIYGYGQDGNDQVELIYVKEADLRTEVNKRPHTFTNTLFDIEIDGVKQRVLARDFQIHPFRPKAICINWLRYREGAFPGARIEIPLKSFNEERCPAIKEGGWLLELTHKLPVYASGPQIPDYLMMDLRGLRLGDKIMASNVILNEGLVLRSKVKDFAVAKLVGSRRGAEDDESKGEDKKEKAKAAKDDKK